MYVVKNKRQREYLYNLGFTYIPKQDLYDTNKEVYLFVDNELLRECLTFYSNIKNKQYK